jgi:phospholipase/lecithinase/hemolysin
MKHFLSLVLFLFSGLLSAASLKGVVVFGDSLSDNGNLYEYMQHQIPASPPYFEGRFSDGPVWVERLVSTYFPKDSTPHLLDYAFGGAGVSEDPNTDMSFTLQRELESYLLSHQDKADARSLFVVWMGANNYLGLPLQVESVVNEVNAGLKHSLQRLADAGAKHILVFNLPDLGQSPYARLVSAESLLSEYTRLHNQKLRESVDALRQSNPNVQWLYFDANTMFNAVVAHPELYGIHNVDSMCYGSTLSNEAMLRSDTLSGLSKPAMIQVASRVAKQVESANCEGYLFFDPVHPTALAHALIAHDVHRLLNDAGVEWDTE